MPPRRKGTSSAKDIEAIISTEDIKKSDVHVSNQDDPDGFAAAVKPQGRKAAMSAKEKGEADIVDLLTTKVSIRSSKQKALQKILSMDKEDADDCTSTNALKPNGGETENDCSGAAADPKQTNKKKQGPRGKKAKKALETIPEDVAVEANFVEPGSKTVSGEAKPVSELCAYEEKPDRGKRRSVRANENDQCKLRKQQEEAQLGKGSQQSKMVTCHKASRKRGEGLSMLEPGHSMTLSSMLAPGHSAMRSPDQASGNLSKKTVDCLSMPMEKRDSLTQAPTKSVAKKDQTLNMRSSTRAKKVVYYNEQSPDSDSNEKRVFVTTESKAEAATKRNASAAKLLPRGAKRVKEDPTSASKGPLGLDSARAICVRRGRGHEELSSPQNLAINNSTASRGTGNKEESKEHPKESNSEQVNSASASINIDLDKGFLLQTAQPESVKFLPAQEGAKLVSATQKRESDRMTHNQVSQNRALSDKPLDEMMADEPTSIEMLSGAGGKSVVQHPIQDLQLIRDRKKSNAYKGRKVDSKSRALPDMAQKAEGDLLESGEAKHKVLEASTQRNDSSAKLLPLGAKMVKEDPTSASEDTIELVSARATHVRRGTRRQKLSHRETEDNEDFRNSEQANSVDLDKSILLQTGQPESVKFSPPQEGAKLVSATVLEKTSDTGSVMHGKRESDHIGHVKTCQKNSSSESSQDQMMADKSACPEVLSVAAGKNDRKKLNTSKGRKVNSRRRALPDTAQEAEGDLVDGLLLGSDEEAKFKVLEAPLVQGANSITDAKPEEMNGTHESADADRKLYGESQKRGRNTFMKKRTVQGTAKQAKKQKISALDTLSSSPASLDMLVEGAIPAQNQEHEKAIQEAEPEDWLAVSSKSRVERSSEKKRREEMKRKRAMKFDALPVGFGLGISCWSTPPWAEQSIEEEVVGEVDLSAMSFQVESKSPMEEAKKQQCLQETAMLKDAKNINTSLDLMDPHQEMESLVMGFQVQLKSPAEEAKKRLRLQEKAMSNDAINTSPGAKDSHLAPSRSATRLQGSNFLISDAKKLPGSGLKSVPTNDSNHQQEKTRVKRQAARKTKASKVVLLESSPVVNTGSDNNIMDKENVQPKLHAHHNESELKTSRNSRRRVATAGMEKTTRTRRN